MQCRQCHGENPSEARFCLHCGTPQSLRCASCGRDLPAEARFCMTCGQAVGGAPAKPAAPSAPAPSLAAPVAQGARAPRSEPMPGPVGSPLPATLGGGRYRVKSFLGEGARKRVYLARDTSLESDVAVAVVKTEGLDADGLIRVRREAQAMGRLRDHPNIVPVFDIGQDGSQPYIVSQLLEGGSVDDRLRELDGHKLPIAEALRIALQVAQALEHAHSLGIVHRDLKPGNVWLARDGTAKLGDFGLAVTLDQSRLTQEGMLVGTVAYIAPEQAMGRTPDARSDLYALGAMLYEMVAGRPPFLGDDAVAVISQHVSTPPVAPSWHNSEVPPRLEALIQELLAKDPTARPQHARDVVERLQHIEQAPPEAAVPPSATGHAVDTRRRAAWGRFVGRRLELDQLKEALEDALGGRGSLAMLVGEPGIGKTRLAEEFTVYARLRGAQVLSGRSYEGAVEVAYFPFVEAFRQYVRARPDADLRRELGEGAPDVANLVSEIRQRFPDLPASPPLQGDAERLRLFGSITEFLRAATAAGPLVLHLDDLHWADTPSLLLLRHLARHLAGERLLILGSYRDVELDRTHPLAEVLGSLRRETTLRRILLRGLPTEDVVAYLTALADEEPDPELLARRRALADALHRETEGNPFFIGEVLSHLVESGKLFWDGAHWRANVTSPSELGIPEGVREVVGRRLSALGDVCNRMLTVASAMPAGFNWDVLRATAEGEEASLLDALEEALAARLIRERPGAQGSYEFTHALIRQTLYEELSAPRRVLLHRHIGERLEALYARDPGPHLAELAHHFFQSAPGGDVAKAVDYAVRAGERGISVAAFEEAVAHFERALQAFELERPADPERRGHVLIKLAEIHSRIGSLDASRAAAVEAEKLARAHGLRDLLALAALSAGGEHIPAFTLDPARVKLLEEALAAFGSEPHELVVRLLRRLIIEFAFFDIARAGQLAERAVEIARRIGKPEVLVFALSGRHLTLGAADRLEERLVLSHELLTVAKQPGLETFEALGRANLHSDLLEKGDAAGAREQLAAYTALAKRTREPVTLWLATTYAGLWATLEGRFEEAERLANEALELARRFEHSGGPSFHAIQISRVRAEQGRLAEMVPIYEEIQKNTPNPGWQARLAQVYAELGREEEARREFEQLAADDFAGIPADSLWLLSLCHAAEACATLRDTKRAEVLYRLLQPHAQRNVVIVNAAVAGPVERYLGKLAATLGRFDDAARHFEAAIAFDRKLGSPPLEARVKVDCARMLLDRSAPGDRERALRLANDALEVAHALGMQLLIERALALKLEAQGIDASDTRRSVYAVATLVQTARPDLAGATAADGTVTLLFSDMEGFTRMTENLGDVAAHQVVQAHNRIVREQTAAHGGREVELRGDGFLLAFSSARQAALCAISLQRALAAHNASNGGDPIRIRIGVHTGEAIKDAEKFFGRTVIQAFRIADLAAGEEILTSSLTAELLRSAGDLRFQAEREVELKGLEGRHRVYALDWR